MRAAATRAAVPRAGKTRDTANSLATPEVFWWRTMSKPVISHRLVVGVAHACRPFAVPVPGELHRLLRADRVAPGYAAHLDGVAARPAEAARGAAFAADFSDLVWDGLSEDDLADTVRHLLARALLPSREDWAAMAVPEPLAVLYPVLRPARLARKYAAAVFAPTGHITPGRRVRRTFR